MNTRKTGLQEEDSRQTACAEADINSYLRPLKRTDPSLLAIRRNGELLAAAMPKYLAGRVLDIGCGTKRKRLLAGSAVTDYVGLDHEGCLHDMSLVDIVASAYEIPEPDESFDGIVCTSVLEHLEDSRAAVAEGYRVLRKGGHAVYTVPLFWHVHEAPRDFYRFTEYGLRYVFESVGYEIVEVIPGSGFWITMGSMWSYYLTWLWRGRFSPLARLLTALANFVVPALDRLDRRFNPYSRRFTWSILMVARKPS